MLKTKVMGMRAFFTHFLCLILIQSQIALAAGPSVPQTPQSPKSSVSVESFPNVKGPSGNAVEAYVIKGMAPTVEGYKRVWAFDKNGKAINGVLVDEAKRLVQWEGQKLEIKADPGRPSSVIEYTTWEENHKKRMRDLTRRLKNGDTKLLQEVQLEQQKEFESNKGNLQKSGGMTNTAIAFYIALGVLAYIELSANYSDNPNAWSDFATSLQDPVGWLMLPAFIVASQKIFQWAATFKGWKSFAASSGAMAVGLITTTILGKMLYDQNLRQCLGFVSFDKNGRFERNDAACDALYDAWAGDELFLTIVPVIGHAVMAGGIVAGLRWFVGLGLNWFELGKKIKISASTVARSGGRGGSVIAVGTTLGSMVLFFGAFKISYLIVDLESSLRDFFLTTFNPFPNPDGKDIPANLRLINRALKAEMEIGFKDKVQIDDLGGTCDALIASARNGKKIDPKLCHGTDVKAALDRHVELMAKWRQYKFKKVNAGYSAWSTRSDGYHKNAVAAYTIYRDFILDLAAHRAGELDMNSAEYRDDRSGIRFTVNQNEALKNSSFEFDGTYKYVAMRDFFDFFLTSMACGPKPEIRTAPLSRLENAKTYIFSQVIPPHMLYNQESEKAVFYPPRLIPDSEINVCSDQPHKLYPTGFKPLDFLVKYVPSGPDLLMTPTLAPSQIWGIYKGEKFRGLLDYMIKALPEELTGPNAEEAFNAWWSVNVLSQFTTVNAEISKNYVEFVDKTYSTVLSNSHTQCWNIKGAEELSGAAALIRQAGIVKECADNTQMRLGDGLAPSVVEQVAFYDNLILKIMDHQNIPTADLRNIMVARLAAEQKMIEGITIRTVGANEALGQAIQEFEQANNSYRELLKNVVTGSQGADRARFLINQLALSTEAAFQEALYYIKVVQGEDVLTATSL